MDDYQDAVYTDYDCMQCFGGGVCQICHGEDDNCNACAGDGDCTVCDGTGGID